MAEAEDLLGSRTLTVNERVLLHLKESGTPRDADAYPLSQPGIAQALGIRVNHVSRAVRALIRERLISERTARVRGEVRRRKIYEVTEAGHGLAQKLAAKISDMFLILSDATGERTVRASHARARASPPTLTRLLTLVDENGRLDLGRPEGGERELAVFEEGRPPAVPLVGRHHEVGAFLDWLEHGPPVLAVTAPHGMGKSALVSSALPKGASSFWWSFRKGDHAGPFLEGLASWLASLGQPELRARLAKGPPDWREVARIVTRDLRGFDVVLVLDDVHEVEKELGPYVDSLIEAVAVAGCKIVATSESLLPNRSILLAESAMQEFSLAGLDRESARQMLPGAPEREFEKVYNLTGGNPLSLKLLAAEKPVGDFAPEERALLKVLRLRNGED